MKSVWTGTIDAGLLVIPVKLGPAVSDDELKLHQVRKSDGSRIAMRRFAKADGKEIAWTDLAPGYETAAGQVVVLDDADFERAYGTKNRQAQVLMFTDLAALPPRTAHDSSYYVQPGAGGERAYALLAKAMQRTGTAAVVSFAMRQREALAVLSATEDGYLVLERLRWAATVRQPDFAAPAADAPDNQVELTENLIAAMTKTFDWAAQADTSAQKLNEVIQGKIETGQLLGVPAAPGSAPAPADLTEILRASVEQARAAAQPARPARKPRARKPQEAKAA